MYRSLRCLIVIPVFLLITFTAVRAQSWSELGGTNSLSASAMINCIYTDAATGNVYAGGSFTNSSFKPYVAKYNDTSWSELGGSNGQLFNVGSSVRAITGDAAGNIYAGGSFVNAGNFRYIAQWEHTTNTWSELGGANSLQANSTISCMTIDPDGNIYAAGGFTNGSAPYNGNRYVARWDHLTNTWSELGGINGLAANGEISTITCDAAGNIYAGGFFTNSNGYNYVAKWNHTTNTWSQLDGANGLFAGTIYTLTSDAAGNIYAAGGFMNLSGNEYVAKWDYASNTWSEVGGNNSLQGNSLIFSIALDPAGNIYACGYLAIGSLRYVAKWDHITNSWSELSGTNHLLVTGSMACVTSDVLGNIYAAGYFTNANDKRYVAKFTPLPVKISVSQNNICAGTSVSYLAETTNISSPYLFQWKVNGNDVGTNSGSYTYLPVNDDTVSCVVVSSSTSDTSNLIVMQVMPVFIPSVAIAVTPSSVVDNGTPVMFTATATNGGNDVQYQWLKNGQAVQGAINVTWSAVSGIDFLPGDVITASLHSDEPCAMPATAVSNAIIMTTKGTGINDAKEGIALRLYPNPNDGTFVIDGTVKEWGEYQIIITNIFGQKMYGQSINATGQKLHAAISVDGLAQGMYYLKMIKDKETVAVKKFERLY